MLENIVYNPSVDCYSLHQEMVNHSLQGEIVNVKIENDKLKNENAELKCFIRDLIYENHNLCFQFSNTTCLFNSEYKNRAEELIGEKL
jgi:hypothetical protein